MKFLTAQLKKDVVSAPLLLGGLAFCWLVDLACLLNQGAVRPFGDYLHASFALGAAETNRTLIFPAIFCAFAQPFLLITLFVRGIQGDSLVDTGAFWRTRPISRLALLGSKALLTIPPLIASLAVIGIILHQIGDLSYWLVSLAFFLGLAAFAAITSNFGKTFGTFVLVGFGAGFVAAIVRGLSNADMTVGSHRWSAHLFDLPALPYESEIKTALFLTGFTAVVVHQYLTLRTRVSLGMLAGIFFVGCLLL